LAVATSPPLGLKATDTGRLPVANGEPTTGVNAGAANAVDAISKHAAHASPNPSQIRRNGAP